MKILFSGVPAYGHLLPMLPLARASQSLGHETAFLTHESMATALAPVPVLPFGLSLVEMVAGFIQAHGPTDPATSDPMDAARMLAGVRIDLTLDDALDAARAFAPDLLVADPLDAVGPAVAAALHVPFAVHQFGPVADEPTGASPSVGLLVMMADLARPRLERRGVTATRRIASVDPCPEILQPPAWHAPADRISIDSGPHRGERSTWRPPVFADQERPVVLISPSTSTLEILGDTTTLPAMVDSTLAAGFNAVVTLGPAGGSLVARVDPGRVDVVNFVPLAEVLPVVDAVVGVAGTGTVLATVRSALPSVLMPMMADQPFNARQAVRAGVAVVVDDPVQVGPALSRVLQDPRFRVAALAVADQMAAMGRPADVVAVLNARVAAGAATS